MKTNPTYIIEQVKADGIVKLLTFYRAALLKDSLALNKKFGIETIAIFKVYPK